MNMKRVFVQFLLTETSIIDGQETELKKSLIISGVDNLHANEYSMDFLANYKLPADATEAEIERRQLEVAEKYQVTLPTGTAVIHDVDDVYLTDKEADALAAVGYLIYAPIPVTESKPIAWMRKDQSSELTHDNDLTDEAKCSGRWTPLYALPALSQLTTLEG